MLEGVQMSGSTVFHLVQTIEDVLASRSQSGARAVAAGDERAARVAVS